MKKLILLFVMSVSAHAQVFQGAFLRGINAPAVPPIPFTQIGSPVLLKGSSYLGLQADAFATPRACWDGSQWVGSFSLWNTANFQWSTLFSTSPDLVTWTPVSLRNPSGSNYILGNGGIGCPTGLTYRYYFSYETYPNGATSVSILVDGSNNLTSWTNITTLSASTYATDSKIVINPNTTNMEIWYINYNGGVTADTVEYQSSSNGSAWTAQGIQYTIPNYFGFSPGEPAPAYSPIGGGNFLLTDETSSTVNSGARFTQILGSATAAANTWNQLGIAQQAATVTIPGTIAEECFDSFIVWANTTHTGPGNIPYMLTACGDNLSGINDTDSDIILSEGTL